MLEDAEIFISVVENNSFSKAARRLKLSAPIVTRHIAKIEGNIGVRLLQRNTRQVSLTEAGAIFYESCKSLMQTYTVSLKQVKSLSHEITGTLKIGLPSSISQLYITPYLNSFMKKHPNLKIDIVNGNHLIDLLSSGFDLIIHCGELSDSNLYCKKLGEWEKITCASPAYFKRFSVPQSPSDLKDHNCLDHYDNRDGSWEYIVNKEIKSVGIHGNMRSNSSMDLKNLVIAGVGISYLPSFIVKHELANGALKSVLSKYKIPALSMYAVYPSNNYLSKKCKLFLEYLSELKMF